MTDGRAADVKKLTLNEIQDEREVRDPKVRAAITKSYQQFVAGKSRPIQELFAEREARTRRGRRQRA